MIIKPKTLERLQYFVGKVCTIFTGPLNRTFDEARAREHFVVRVQDIDADGLWGTHPYNGTVSFFFLESIDLITEEIELDPNNPDHLKMIREYEEKTGKKVFSDVSPHLAPSLHEPPKAVPPEPIENQHEEPAFVSVKNLSNLAREVKKTLNATDTSSWLNS